MAKSFYVTLQSNACMGLFPDNKISDFRNRLGTLISLPAGQWEVALSSISYTAGLAYIKHGEHLFTIQDDPTSVRPDPPRLVYSTSDVTTFSDLSDTFESVLPDSKFTFNVRSLLKYSVPMTKSNQAIYATPKIRDMLGLKSTNLGDRVNNFISTHASGKPIVNGRPPYQVDLISGNTKLFIYSNLIRPQFIGDKMAPCMRVVSYSGASQTTQYVEFIHEQYLDLAISEFDIVHMFIMNESGELVPFQFGNFTATLRFREKKQ